MDPQSNSTSEAAWRLLQNAKTIKENRKERKHKKRIKLANPIPDARLEANALRDKTAKRKKKARKAAAKTRRH